jgi:hypothetical protein
MGHLGANAAILVYDITSSESFDNVKDWVRGECLFACVRLFCKRTVFVDRQFLSFFPELNSNVHNDIGKVALDEWVDRNSLFLFDNALQCLPLLATRVTWIHIARWTR